MGGLLKALFRRLGLSAPAEVARRGEAAAARYLERRGYRILARNFHVRGGEADLMALRGDLLVVVEVKTRTGEGFGPPEAAVDERKSRRVLKAGRLFARRKGISLSRLRGDVVAVVFPPGGGEAQIRHYPNVLRDPQERLPR
ncbi:MAG: YraN family protein [Acidobacteriota bacterium]